MAESVRVSVVLPVPEAPIVASGPTITFALLRLATDALGTAERAISS